MSADLPDAPDAGGWVRVARLAELGVMTSSLLHELRQPLFAIKALAELTAVQGADPQVDARMRSLLTQVEHIEGLIGHYGGLGRDDEPMVRFDLRQPLGHAVAMFGHRARQGSVDLRLDPLTTAHWVRGRESAARQMAINLVHNAMDAVLGRERRVVSVHAGADEAVVWFEVRDTGPGIPEDVQQRLFEPFFTTKDEGRGTGLGLHITQALAEEAGGRIDLASELEVGTRVRVTLPAG